MNKPISVSKYLPHYKGTTKTLDFDEHPTCIYCKKPMKIDKTYIIGPIVGLSENYHVQKLTYRYGKALCPGGEEPPIKPKDPEIRNSIILNSITLFYISVLLDLKI